MTNRREFLQLTAGATLATAASHHAIANESRQLPKRKIPGTDESLSIVGLGNSVSFREDDLSVASKLIDVFLEHGGGYVDVGGSSRFSVGKLALEKSASSQLFLGNYLDPNDREVMHAEASTVAAGQDKMVLDLVQTRNVQQYRLQYEDYLSLKEEELVRHIGIARSGRRAFETIGELVKDGLVDFVQVNYSLLEPEAADRLLPLAMDHGVAVNINRPFINGEYFSIVRGNELPGWAEDFDCHSWAQFSLKFILSHPAVTCVLTETANPKHALDNLAAGFGRLPDERERRRMLDLMRSYT